MIERIAEIGDDSRLITTDTIQRIEMKTLL